MKSERQKMLAGELYDPGDPELCAGRLAARLLCQAFANTRADQRDERAKILRELFGRETDASIQAPFFCDYGVNITLGAGVFFNFNCVVLDVAPVRIGDNTLFGPAVQILTPVHPFDATERRAGLEAGRAIEIGDDVWVGGGAIIGPGVRIGARSVIGAGSVVTKDIPADVVAVGNPCRVIRQLPAPGGAAISAAASRPVSP